MLGLTGRVPGMAKFNQAILKAYAETYTQAEVTAWRSAAMAAHAANLPRVEITSVTLEGSTGAGMFVDKNPLELIELFTAVLELMRHGTGDGRRVNDRVVHGDFSQRAVGW